MLKKDARRKEAPELIFIKQDAQTFPSLQHNDAAHPAGTLSRLKLSTRRRRAILAMATASCCLFRWSLMQVASTKLCYSSSGGNLASALCWAEPDSGERTHRTDYGLGDAARAVPLLHLGPVRLLLGHPRDGQASALHQHEESVHVYWSNETVFGPT